MIFETRVNGHAIEIWASIWNGKERVRYDGRVVSEKRSLMFQSIHSFEAEEQGEKAVYEVMIHTGLFTLGYAVRRNGIIQAHKP